MVSALFTLVAAGAMALCYFEWRRLKGPALPVIWLVLAATLIFIGWPTHYTVMGEFTQRLRDSAAAEGWYNNRRVFQEMALFGAVLIGTVGTLALCALLWKRLARYGPALLSISFFVAFLVIELLSEHDIDRIITRMAGPINVYTWLLLFGLSLSSASLAWAFACDVRFLRHGAAPGFGSGAPETLLYRAPRSASSIARKLLLAHSVLPGVALFLASHDNTALRWWGCLAVLTVNLLLWLLVTIPRAQLRFQGFRLRRPPVLIALGGLYFAVQRAQFARAELASTVDWLVSSVIVALMAVSILFLLANSKETGPLMAGVALAGVAVCIEALVVEFGRTHGFTDLITRSPFRRDLPPEQITRLMSPIAYPNSLATELMLFAVFALTLIDSSRSPRQKIAWLAASGLIVLCMLLTGSRGGIITLGLAIMAHLARRHRSLRPYLSAAALLFVGAILWMLRKPYAQLRGSGSLRQRLHGWIVTESIVLRSPWFGEGPGAFSRAWLTYGPAHGYANQFGMDGFYANLMCEGGLFSLAVLALLVGLAAAEVVRLLRSQAPAQIRDLLFCTILSLIAVLLHNLVETTLGNQTILMMLGLLVGATTAVRGRIDDASKR